MPTVWILDGDPAMHQTALGRALHLLEVAVDVVPCGHGVRYWRWPLPDLLLFGASATAPPHPLVVRAIGAPTCRAMLLTVGPRRIRGRFDRLVLPASVPDVVEALQRALALPTTPPVRVPEVSRPAE